MKEKNLSLEFRLKDIGERIFYLLEEVEQNELMIGTQRKVFYNSILY